MANSCGDARIMRRDDGTCYKTRSGDIAVCQMKSTANLGIFRGRSIISPKKLPLAKPRPAGLLCVA